MIYLPVDPAEPIRQGDIFRHVPRVDMSLSDLSIFGASDSIKRADWKDVVTGCKDPEVICAVLAMKPVMGIVITQDCDASRGYSISLCQVDDYLEATKTTEPTTSKKWQSAIIGMARKNTRFFYLPPDESRDIKKRMAADFRLVLSVSRCDLESMRDLRVGRLNDTALAHFRESIAHFFRRYAYNEWYPLSKDELQEYSASLDEPIPPFDWQK